MFTQSHTLSISVFFNCSNMLNPFHFRCTQQTFWDHQYGHLCKIHLKNVSTKLQFNKTESNQNYPKLARHKLSSTKASRIFSMLVNTSNSFPILYLMHQNLSRESVFTLKLLRHSKELEAEHYLGVRSSCKFMAMEETPQHFFKVVLASTLQDKKLRIPNKFVRKFRDELSAFAMITAPDGRVWQVGLLKDGGKIWFHHGLQDFIKYYSICVGYFLVFKYEKRSNFHVIILDMSTLEISYPYDFEEPKKKENLIHKEEDYRDHQGAANLNSSSNKCKMEEHVEVNTNTTHNGEDEDPTQIKDLHKLRALLEDKRIFLSEKYNFSSAKERERLFTLARSLKLINPSFMIVLLPSHLKSHSVYLPAQFTNRYLTRDIESFKVRSSSGREWPVRISWKNHGCCALRGWTKFLNDMKIKARDICVFELIRTKDLLLEVSLFKESGKVI